MKIDVFKSGRNSPGARFLAVAFIVILASAAVHQLEQQDFRGGAFAGGSSHAAQALDELPRNTWVELATNETELPDFRTDHGGAVYVPDRNSVFLFGSDTHLHGFDNGIYELRLDDLRWRKRHEAVPSYTMRTDAEGVRIAGAEGRYPWPMHVYDSIVYDPVARQIIVTSGAKHDFVPRPGRQLDPLWAYVPRENRWKMLNQHGPMGPVFFSAGTVYDPTRDTIIGYGALAEPRPFLPLAAEKDVRRTGVWELGPDRSRWVLVSDAVYHSGWFNLEFDQANRAMLVFGGHDNDSSIWAYEVGEAIGETGRWVRRIPAGDICPGGDYFPAAYDSKRHVTLYMPVDPATGRRITCVYDYARNEVRRLDGAELRDTGLNYTIVYAAREDVFLLVTGSFSRGVATEVRVLRLDMGGLDW